MGTLCSKDTTTDTTTISTAPHTPKLRTTPDSTTTPTCAPPIRAAFDVGSGATKFAVAAVDSSTDCLPLGGASSSVTLVGPILTEDNREVLLKHALVNGRISDKALQECYATLQEYVQRALQKGATELIGVATAVFREASNGQEFLNKVRTELGIHIFIASQRFEGTLGYRTATHAARDTKERHVRRTPSKKRGRARQLNVLAWDSGGASFQITRGDGSMYGGAVGSSTVLQMMMNLQGKLFTGRTIKSANPATLNDCERLHKELMSTHMPRIEDWLAAVMDGGVASGMRVVAIGGDTCAFRMCDIATGNSTFSASDVWEAIEHFVGMDDDMLRELSFLQPEMLLPKLVLIYTVMRHVGIVEAEYHRTTGSTLGLLSTTMEDIQKEMTVDAKNREDDDRMTDDRCEGIEKVIRF